MVRSRVPKFTTGCPSSYGSGLQKNSSVEDDGVDTSPNLPLQVSLKRWTKPWRLGVRKGFVANIWSPRPMLYCGVDSGYIPTYSSKVHVQYMKSMSPDDVGVWHSTQRAIHGDIYCYHDQDGKVPSVGTWLGGVREIIHGAYFETNLKIQKIALCASLNCLVMVCRA